MEIGFTLVQTCHFGAIDSSTTKPLPFLRLLHSLAFEWAKSAVAITRHFFGEICHKFFICFFYSEALCNKTRV